MAEQVGRTGDAARQFAAAGAAGQPEAAYRVTVAVVPFSEAGRECAGRPGGDVPRLGDELGARQYRVLAQGVEKGGACVEPGGTACQCGGQVKAEAVDMHVAHPEAQ